MLLNAILTQVVQSLVLGIIFQCIIFSLGISSFFNILFYTRDYSTFCVFPLSFHQSMEYAVFVAVFQCFAMRDVLTFKNYVFGKAINIPYILHFLMLSENAN